MTGLMMGKDVHWGVLELLMAGHVLIFQVEIQLVRQFVETEEWFFLKFVTMGLKIILSLLKSKDV